jgi:hypothetical protein
MHSSQSSKNKIIREGSRPSRRLSFCVSYQKVVNVFRFNLVFGVYSAVELAEFCDATPWSLAFRGSCCRRPQRRCNSALEVTSRRLLLPTNCTDRLAFLMEVKCLSCKAEHVLKVLFTLMADFRWEGRAVEAWNISNKVVLFPPSYPPDIQCFWLLKWLSYCT